VTSQETHLTGIAFSKQFPNSAESLRGLFVAEQVRATSYAVSWSVIAPAPYTPRFLSRVLPRPYVSRGSRFGDLDVQHPPYHVLPRRIGYRTVGREMARGARRTFGEAVRNTHPTFVHIHTLYPAGAAGRILAREHELPYIVTIHGSDLYSNMKRPAWVARLRRVVDDAAAIVCVSDSLAQDAIAMVGARPERTLVIPNSFDASTFSPRPKSLRVRPTLLTVGRLVDVKGHRFLIEAVAALVSAYPELALRIAGEGPERRALQARAAELDIADHVEFLGNLTPDRLSEEYHRADLFVLPSVREGFGVVVVEALASGTPVVATRSGGPESILCAQCGELVAPGDAGELASGISRALSRAGEFDPDALSSYVGERYGSGVVGARLVKLYEEVAAGRMPSATLAEGGVQ